MGMSQRSQQRMLLRHVYDMYDRQSGAGFPNVSGLGPAVGMSAQAARQLVDLCVQEKLAYLFASVADPCIGLTDAGRAVAKDGP